MKLFASVRYFLVLTGCALRCSPRAIPVRPVAGCGGRAGSGWAAAAGGGQPTSRLKEEPVTLTTELPGRTSAFRIAEVRPQVNGVLLQKRLFTEGADVQEGQQLYQIDPAPYQAALDTAMASAAKGAGQ